MHYLLSHILTHSAEVHADRTAFVFGEQHLSFREMEERTNQLAHFLRKQGVKRGDRIGIYLNRSVASVIAVYGILKAGAAYVPVDTSAPLSRLRFIVEDCELRFLFAGMPQRRQLTQLFTSPPESLLGVMGLERDWPVATYDWSVIDDQPKTALDLRVLADDLAYVMYTSGSTGTPKGIMHTHRSGLAYAKLSAELYNLQPTDIVANHCALHYDISTFGYFAAPLAGARVVLLSDAHVKMPSSLLALLAATQVTVWYSVPLALIQLLESGLLPNYNLSSLRWILTGGEPFAAAQIRALMKHCEAAVFSNVYGPAEVNQCTYYHFNEAPEGEDAIPLGQFWGNTEGLVLNSDDKEVAIDEIGELLIRSATMMRGYWKRPDLTIKGFHKIEVLPGFIKTYYRTGDLVKYNKEGQLLFMGRKDRQIKTRGYRVELEEVENALHALEDVFSAAVFATKNGTQGKLIETLLILHPGVVPDADKLLRQLMPALPHYAIPHKIHFTETIPRTPAGKIDRKAILRQINN